MDGHSEERMRLHVEAQRASARSSQAEVIDGLDRALGHLNEIEDEYLDPDSEVYAMVNQAAALTKKALDKAKEMKI